MPVRQYLVTYSTAVSDGEIPPYSKIQKTLRRRFERDPNVSVSVEELLTTQEAQDRYVFMADLEGPDAWRASMTVLRKALEDRLGNLEKSTGKYADTRLGALEGWCRDLQLRIKNLESAAAQELITSTHDDEARIMARLEELDADFNRRIDTLTVRLNKITGIRLYDTDPDPDELAKEPIETDAVGGLHGTGDLTIESPYGTITVGQEKIVVEDGAEVDLTDLHRHQEDQLDEEWIPNPVPQDGWKDWQQSVVAREATQETAMNAADFLETDGQMLSRLGTDARNWAQEFMRIIGPNPVDEGLMVSWFANAIEAGRSAGQMQAPVSVAVLHTQSFESWKAIIGEGFHTAFRKAGNSMAATQAHLNIKSMTAAEWDTILSFVVDWLERAGWIEVRHGEVTA